MELITKSDTPAINEEAIQKGDLIRAKYSAWTEERNGQVAAVTRDEIRVIWQPNIRNVTNFFSIYADELADGLWIVKWTPDMETFNMYPGTGKKRGTKRRRRRREDGDGDIGAADEAGGIAL